MSDVIPHRDPERIEIRPSRGVFDLDLDNVWRYRELLLMLVWRDISVLYKQAALGVSWAIIQPVFAVIIFTIVFGLFARIETDGIPYPVFAFAGVLPWTYFAEAVRRSGVSLVTDADLVRKVYFPRLLLPIASVTAPLVDFCIAFVILIGLMFWYDIAITWKLLIIPPLMVVAGLLALSVGMWLSPINVRFRDIKHTLPFMIQIWMYATPIVYPLSLVPEQYQGIYALNPMVGVIEGFRWAVFDRGDPNFLATSVSATVIVVLLIGGLIFFKRMERSFADLI